MQLWQILLIALFIYLGSIGSIIGNTLGWYTLGRPLIASLVVGLIMGDVQSALVVGIPLQIMYMGSVTPGGAVAWDLSYATYIGVAGALFLGQGMDTTQLIGLGVLFAGIGGFVGQLMWNLSYACNLPLNLVAERYAKEGDAKKMYIPNTVLGQLIGFACRFIPAVILLTTMTAASAPPSTWTLPGRAGISAVSAMARYTASICAGCFPQTPWTLTISSSLL